MMYECVTLKKKLFISHAKNCLGKTHRLRRKFKRTVPTDNMELEQKNSEQHVQQTRYHSKKDEQRPKMPDGTQGSWAVPSGQKVSVWHHPQHWSGEAQCYMGAQPSAWRTPRPSDTPLRLPCDSPWSDPLA